ncbi:MAG: SAM-dependent methyltransferase [Gammaproteobacteria bacterium]|nr:SAM-dependent methyltransferase [Gammaproteobacteria bacterium]MBU1555700.1 SAM-dependent methyltransferase [Gammaproteobacteria bacterium]MBU2072637.1 SAM-dependent methyltransferase [Gammaproteobacteria bacterium]MBU2182229.1 SAM-dependent methyltransferase [Gammaproteobacteria bacterium]MBU2204843.1 SAM-dependent methyltransferase [Gammaproteobacteria bacterium]
MSQPPLQNPQLEAFFAQLSAAISEQQLVKLVLSKYQGAEPLKQLQVRPVLLKQQWQLSFTYKYQTNDQSKNFTAEAALAELQRIIATEFSAANLFTQQQEVQLNISKKGKALIQAKKINTEVKVATVEHNREKQRYLTLERPFLRELGVTDAAQQLIPAMSRKWKQINKFIEIFSGAVTDSGLASQQQLHIADFGSGKAYLTFAVHDYLTNSLGLAAQVTGVELRQALVDHCNHTATKLNLAGIRFEQGDVKHFKARGINVMIALHACDIATDYAIHMGIATGAEIIMCSPCCHKELRPQLTPPAVLAGPLNYGIHLGQEAEMLTDSLRAMLLEAKGYDTKVFEFISLEHTSKNKMILATKRRQARDNSKVLQQIAELKSFYGIKQQCLETLLQSDNV